MEDGLLGLVAFDADHLRQTAPTVHNSKLANGATVAVRVENTRQPRVNHSFILAVSTSRLRRRVRVGDRRIPLVMVIFRAAEQSREWVPVFRGTGLAQGSAVFFDDAKLDLVTACLGDAARPLRIALFRIDSEKKFKMVAFFETAFTALQMLVENKDKTERKHAVQQPLQGRYYDDAPGNVTFVRVASDEGLRVAVRFDIFNAPQFLSSYSRPRRQSQKLHEVFDEEDSVRSKRMDSSFSPATAASRVEQTAAYDKPPPSYRFSLAKPGGLSPLKTLLMGN